MELGLFILWEKSRYQQKQIVDDIKEKFNIIGFFDILWSKEKFSNNLSRFYGENLPKNSFKEKECGIGSFLLIIVEDKNPLYLYRKTSKGIKKVNVNFFDAKDMYRSWTGGGHKIHATNDMNEFKHDLMMLLGVNIEDYLRQYKQSNEIIEIKQNIVGADGWKSLDQVFHVLNETIDYVVLRNFDNLPKQYQIGEHGDIDILCSNYYNICAVLNSRAISKQKSRVRNCITIKGEEIFFDFRHIGDNYYDKKWEKKILNTRKEKNGFYIPDDENYKYSLLYHALVHKKVISKDYIERFQKMFNGKDNYKEIIKNYLLKNEYEFVNPNDISVYFNTDNSNKKNSIKKQLYFKLYPVLRRIKLN